MKRIGAARAIRRELEDRRRRLERMALSWCQDPMLADDLVQECLARAWEKRHQLQTVERLDAWLFRILHNCWMEHLRRRRTTTELHETLEAPDQEPGWLLDRHQLAERVRQAVAALPEGQRQVVTLVDLEGFRYAEVAEILEIPPGTVMSRLSRARERLRAALLHLQAPMEEAQPRLRRVK